MLNPSLPWGPDRPALPARAAIAAITAYQRHLSPRKGFACAYRVHHRAESCSQYAKRMVQEQGLRAAAGRLRARFTECRAAHLALRAAGIDAVAFDASGLPILGPAIAQAGTYCIPTPIGCCFVSG